MGAVLGPGCSPRVLPVGLIVSLSILSWVSRKVNMHGWEEPTSMMVVVVWLQSCFSLSFAQCFLSSLQSTQLFFVALGDPSNSEVGRLSNGIQKEQEVQVKRQLLLKPLLCLLLSVTVQPSACLPADSHSCPWVCG